MKRKTWKQKLTKAQLAHVKNTTQRGTLAEVKANIESSLREVSPFGRCFKCEEIGRRLGLTQS